MSSDKQTSNQSDEKSSLEIDISTLASLIASTTMTSTTNGARTKDPGTVAEEEADGLGMEEVEELMSRLEAANGIAEGVEDKLNGILEHLDGLLNSLEAKGETKEDGGSNNSQSDR